MGSTVRSIEAVVPLPCWSSDWFVTIFSPAAGSYRDDLCVTETFPKAFAVRHIS